MSTPNYVKSFKNLIIAHKKVSIVIAVVLVFGTYGLIKVFGDTSTTTSYVYGSVEKGNIISTVTGSGQVSASNEFALKTKASGEVLILNAVVGKEVKQGALIAEVDPGTAGLALKNAQLSYDKKFTVDSSTLLQTKNAVDSASTSLSVSYEQGVSDVTSSYASMNDVLNSLKTLFENSGYLSSSNGFSFTDTARVYRDSANGTYIDAQNAVNAGVTSFKPSDMTSSESIKKALTNAKEASKKLSLATQNAQKAADYVRLGGNNASKDETARVSIASMVSSSNTISSSLTSALSEILSSERNLQEKQDSLTTLQEGPDAVEASAAQLSLAQQQESYQNYFTYAPFDGVLATLDIKKGDTVSSGASIGTFITKNQVAEITLNEVDATKVKAGQKVTLTFDAVEDLTITGSVVQVDLVGTVSQGVVSYKVKIGFDTQDDRVKSGMSVSASIITDSKQNVLVVSSSAIKSNTDGTSYVEVTNANSTTPEQVSVSVGLSDDTSTEIISGLKEGDKIITKTTTSTTAKTTTAKSATSLLGGTRTTSGGMPRN